MPLLPDGRFECEACGVPHGYLPSKEDGGPPTGDPADLLGPMICTGCGGVDKADTATSFTGPDGNRHNLFGAADVALAEAFYANAGTPWTKPVEADAQAPARPQPAAG